MLFVCLLLYIVKNGNFFLQVSLDVSALRLGHVLHRVLIGLQLADLLPLEHHFLSKLFDLFFKLSDGRIEAERLLKPHLCGCVLPTTDD